MLSVGLTGGIGSGKSTVAAMLAARGAVVVDADRIAREIVEPGEPTLAAVVERFGDAVLTPDGRLDRPALAALVFHDPVALSDLNAIMHPVIATRSAALIAAAPDDAVVVHDTPLLVEQGLDDAYDVVVVVDASDEIRVERLVRLRGMSEVDARARMAAQATRDERLAAADFVIENEGNEAALSAQVDFLWEELVSAAQV